MLIIKFEFIRFDFDLETSDIYKMLINITPNHIENTYNNKTNELKTSNVDLEIQKVWKLHYLFYT